MNKIEIIIYKMYQMDDNKHIMRLFVLDVQNIEKLKMIMFLMEYLDGIILQRSVWTNAQANEYEVRIRQGDIGS